MEELKLSLDFELITDLNETYLATENDFAEILPGEKENCKVNGEDRAYFNKKTRRFTFDGSLQF